MVLNKLKSRSFRSSSLSTCDFSTLYTTLPHNLIKEKYNDLIEWTFHREGSLYLRHVTKEMLFFSLPKNIEIIPYGHVEKCVKLSLFYLTIFIRFGSKLFRQIVCIPLGTNCAPRVPICSCSVVKETSWCLSLKKSNLVIEAFSSTSSYLDDLLNIDIKYFDGWLCQIYLSELQLNKANSSETKGPFLDLHLSILDGFISCKIYDKRDDFDFECKLSLLG